MYTTLQKDYYQHIESFNTTQKKTNRKQLLIKDLLKDLPKNVQKYILSTKLLLSLPYNKNLLTEWIEILASMYNRQQKHKVKDKEILEPIKENNVKVNNKNLLESLEYNSNLLLFLFLFLIICYYDFFHIYCCLYVY